MRANADKYHLDVDHIGALGWSSGAHLAQFLGLLDYDAFPNESDNMEFSCKVQAIASIAGPTELTLMHDEATYPGISNAIEELMGGSPKELVQEYQEASPLYHISIDWTYDK